MPDTQVANDNPVTKSTAPGREFTMPGASIYRRAGKYLWLSWGSAGRGMAGLTGYNHLWKIYQSLKHQFSSEFRVAMKLSATAVNNAHARHIAACLHISTS